MILHVVGAALLATLLFVILKGIARWQTRDGSFAIWPGKRETRDTVVIIGPLQSGKTRLFFSLLGRGPFTLVHSIAANCATVGRWMLVDQQWDPSRALAHPSEYFHLARLGALVVTGAECLDHDVADVVAMAVAVSLLAKCPLLVLHSSVPSSTPSSTQSSMSSSMSSSTPSDPHPLASLQTRVMRSLHTLQQSRLASIALEDTLSRALSRDDPLNRLLFEGAEGDVAEYTAVIKDHFRRLVIMCEDAQDVRRRLALDCNET